MNSTPLVNKADDYVFGLFKNSSNSNLLFHNYKHTHDVVAGVTEIANAQNVTKDEVELLQLAAWFHDVGYIQKGKGHEAVSIARAQEFLEAEKINPQKIDLVKELIEVTELGKEPKSLLQEIICDADILSIGTSGYIDRSALLRLESEQMSGKSVDELEWLNWELKFLNEHKFYTRYALLNYNDQKTKNIVQRKQELKKLEKRLEEQGIKNSEKKVKSNKSEVPQRGIETMFRTTLRNHINLSAIADNKANLMLSINAIIISIAISVLIPNYKSNPELNVPMVFLLSVCVLSIIFATLSTRPKITQGTFTREDVLAKKANLLFFGNFFNTPIDEFEWGMNEMMKDKDFLYGSMIRDLHSLGKVLDRKYRYLRITYLIFMYGITLAVILFAAYIAFDL